MSTPSVLKSALLNQQANLVFGLSTRLGGVSPPPLGMNISFNVGDNPDNVNRNRTLFFGSLQVGLDELAFPKQIHSNTVRRVDAPGIYPDCDALITNCVRVFICVTVADCVPIFLYDHATNAVAAIHAGWRGTASLITEEAIAAMVREFGSNPEDVVAYVGPCADKCCYNVGEEVATKFAPQFVYRSDGLIYVDLKTANQYQLTRSGVPPSRIEISEHCTISDSRLFHSYRRDKEKSGRMVGVIGITRL